VQALCRLQFQFTHPGRGATASTPLGRVDLKFQFTHPGRGATRLAYRSCLEPLGFNSRTPGGVRRSCLQLPRCDESVSIHAPREGCDCDQHNDTNQNREFQFTHPGRGATATNITTLTKTESFNSRTPGGVRLIVPPFSILDTRFNSRTPGGVRLIRWRSHADRAMFQFTHPGRGATPARSSRQYGLSRFQFTHPGRGATRRPSTYPRGRASFNSRTPGGVRLYSVLSYFV